MVVFVSKEHNGRKLLLTTVAALLTLGDVTTAQKHEYGLGLRIPNEYEKAAIDVAMPRQTLKRRTEPLPESYDAREAYGHCKAFQVMQQVPQQGGTCGSCWAFAAASSLSARFCIQGTKRGDPESANVVLSPQNYLSCSGKDRGCDAYWPAEAYKEQMSGKSQVLDSCDAYTGKDVFLGDKCGSHCKDSKEYGISSWTDLPLREYSSNIRKIKEAIYDDGPVAVAFYANSEVLNNYDGAYYVLRGQKDVGVNHAVVAVGWGTEQVGSEKLEYLIIQNSWGTKWGNGGFGRIAVNELSLGYGASWAQPGAVKELNPIVSEKPGSRLNFGEAFRRARDNHGRSRLPYIDEVREAMKEAGPLYPGEDQWAAVVGRNGERDFVQIGDLNHAPGKSHVAHYGYPAWGDKKDMFNPTWNYVALHKVSAIDMSGWTAESYGSHSYEEAVAYARRVGGRLLTLAEARSLMGVGGTDRALFPGQDQWAAVIGTNGERDYVQIGDLNHNRGKSHVEVYGFPQWGDRKELARGWNKVVLYTVDK